MHLSNEDLKCGYSKLRYAIGIKCILDFDKNVKSIKNVK